MNEAGLLPVVQEALETYGVKYDVLECRPDMADTAAFCEHYHFSLDQSANTIIVASKTDPVQYAACVMLATTRLDVNKKVCQLMGIRKASFATADQTIDLTGMMIGGVTAFGLKDVPIYVDSAVLAQSLVVMGGGNRSSKLTLNPAELKKLPDVQIIDDLAKPKDPS